MTDSLQTDRDNMNSADLPADTPVRDAPVHPPSASQTSLGRRPKIVRMPDDTAAERGQGPFSGITSNDTSPLAGSKARPGTSRSSSWFGVRKFDQSYEDFDSRNASEYFSFADGDIPKNKTSRIYHYLLNESIVTRWIILIVPVMVVLWIPGIVGVTTFPKAHIWGVKLLWWSIWLSIVWGGWWVAIAASWLFPRVTRTTVGLVAIETRRYINWLGALHRYVALFAWTLGIWVSWNPLIDRRQSSGASSSSRNTIDLIGKLLFAIFLCAALLLFEKFSIQWIAGKFHEKSYAERIADQKFAVNSLITLYRNSAEIGRTDTLRAVPDTQKGPIANSQRFFKSLRHGMRSAAMNTTTAIGNVASEIAGGSVLQPNSPQAMVKTALESANKSRLLARRLFYSFAKPDAEYLVVGDITLFFHTPEEADAVFALLDKDGNGDATRDEVEMACMEIHREQLSIEHSMQDVDSAVGRLDNILMSLYVVIAILIIAIALDAELVSVITGAGALILGLSWLIGGSLQEVLTSIIFLFVKHPFDVGDRVTLSKETYTVKEIRLLSTIFLDGNGTCVQAPNMELNKLFIQNIRRSPQMSETFQFDVSYSTTFHQLETLREKMLEFVKTERRDFQPAFDVVVVDFPDQDKMTLKADIKYKSNWQQGGLKATRRNKWICALKTILAELKIYGPKGDPDAQPSTSKYTLVPWEKVQEDERIAKREEILAPAAHSVPVGGWQLRDKNAVIADDSADVFGESDQLHMTNPRRGPIPGMNPSGPRPPGIPTVQIAPVIMPSPTTVPSGPAEHIEMDRRA